MTQGSPLRRRPRSHDGTSEAERAFCEATEKLLAITPFADITVAQILSAAGLSRANFYHYFASKYDVLVAILESVFDESYGADAPWSADPGRDRARRMGFSLDHTLQMWFRHGDLVCAVIEHMHSNSQVASAWQSMFARFSEAVAEQIRFERDSGSAPVGPPAEMLAAMLVGSAERVFYVTTRRLDPRLSSGDSVMASLAAVTEAATFGGRLGTLAEPSTVAEIAGGLAVEDVTDDEIHASETAQAILEAMGALLESNTLAELSVATILTASETSRASFYFYFKSKEDAFTVLFKQWARAIVQGFGSVLTTENLTAQDVISQVGYWLDLDGRRGAVIKNAVHEWPRLPELRVEYLAAMRSMETTLEAVIVRDRPAGVAISEPPAAEYAATLLWTVERVVAGSLAGESHLKDLHAVTEMVGWFLHAALYGERPTRTQ